MSSQVPTPQPSGLPSQPRRKPTAVVYWLRVGIAVLAGVANGLLGINVTTYGDLALIVGIGLGIVFYLMSVFIVRYFLRYTELQLKGKNRYITLGGGTFIVVWVTVAVMLNTLRVA